MVDYEKDIEIVPVPNTALWKIRFTGGGEVPAVMRGLYTSPAIAQAAIERAKTAYTRRIPKSKQAQ